jgi:hypothetical protein
MISRYALYKYPQVFGGAGCISAHWSDLGDALFSYMKNSLPDPGNHRIWFDHGTETLDAEYALYQKKADAIMLQKGYNTSRY